MNVTRTGVPVVFGEVLFDRFPDGSVVLGGAPFNVAWNLQALGLSPILVSRVGDDELGEDILSAMAGWGMDTAGIQRDPRHPTGTVEVSVEDGEPSFEIAPGRAYDFISAEDLPAIDRAGILYHGSLALRTESPRSALDRLRWAAGCPAFMDVNLRAPWWDQSQVMELIDEATWVKLNEHELSALVPGEMDLRRRSDQLLDWCGLEGLVVTRGAAGAWACGRGDWELEPEPAVAPRVIDTVGAGDAFASVVICGLMRNWPWSRILQRAQSFAAAVVGLRGATSDERSFYESFLENWELA